MLTLNISKAEIERLKYERYSYPCALVQKRLHVLYMKSETQLSNEMIGFIAGVHRDTVTDYIRMFEEDGLAAIYRLRYGTNRNELENHTDSLLSQFENSPPHSIAEAVDKIKKLTEVQRSPTQVSAWMKRHGLKYRKTGQIPAKAEKKSKRNM